NLNGCHTDSKHHLVAQKLASQFGMILRRMGHKFTCSCADAVEISHQAAEVRSEDLAAFRAKAARDVGSEPALHGQELVVSFGEQSLHRPVFGDGKLIQPATVDGLSGARGKERSEEQSKRCAEYE